MRGHVNRSGPLPRGVGYAYTLYPCADEETKTRPFILRAKTFEVVNLLLWIREVKMAMSSAML